MKKLLKFASVLLILIMIAQVLAACVKTPEPQPESDTEIESLTDVQTETETDTATDTETETETETEPEIILGAPGTYTEIVEGADNEKVSLLNAGYKIIHDTKASEHLRTVVATELYKELYEKTGGLFHIKADAMTVESKNEILLGKTNRELQTVDADKLSYYDYGWKYVDGKIAIFGGSDAALDVAVEKFVEKYCDAENKTLEIPKDIEYRAYYSYPYSNITIAGTDISEFKLASKRSMEKELLYVWNAFGELCGVKLEKVTVAEGTDAPEGKVIKVGLDTTGNLDMACRIENGALNFVSNGETNDMNQLARVISEFFEANFSMSETVQTVDITADMDSVSGIKFNYLELAPEGLIEQLDAEFEDKAEDIRNSASEWETGEGGQVFYVSTNGNDKNDGLSPETPWRTLNKVNTALAVTPGSVVLFKRGDVWNMEGMLLTRTGVTYSAYGDGAKPLISAYIEANDKGDWTEVKDNIWVYSGEYASRLVEGYPNDPELAGSYVTSLDTRDGGLADSDANDDIGNIVFTKTDGSIGWGAKVMKNIKTNRTLGTGTVLTGFDFTIDGKARPFIDELDLTQNLEFYCNPKTSRFYLYWDEGNPAEYFADIKVVTAGYLGAGDAEDVVIDNISFMYAGSHGISVAGADNYTVRNCEFAWIGGSIQMYDLWGDSAWPTRFGGAVQNWGHCQGFNLTNNIFRQVYDGAVSSQIMTDNNRTSCIMSDVNVTGNLFEQNTSAFEFWMGVNEWQQMNENFKFVDFNYSGNMARKIGLGFGQTRFDKGGSAFCSGHATLFHLYEECHLTNNKVWDSSVKLISGNGYHMEDREMLYGNILVQEYDAQLGDFKQGVMSSYNDATITELVENGTLGENKYYFIYEK